jgi:RimJ/RimL family protein N-acetyltransferase
VGAFLPITTERLVLRAFEPADAAAFSAYRSDPAVAELQSWETPFTFEMAERFIAECPDGGPVKGEWVQIAVTRDGALIGDVAVGLDQHGLIATVGYSLATAHQGKGLAREAVGAVVDRLFDELGVHRVEANVDPRNIASARLIEDLGFAYEGTAVSAVWSRGEWTDEDHYAFTEDSRAAWMERPRNRPADVRLVEVTPDNQSKLWRLKTHRNQQRFVATMPESFADALVPEVIDGAPVVPWMRGVEADGEMVGFVMLAEVTDAHSEPYLWRLFVDRRHQRRGIGDRILQLIVDRLVEEGHSTLLTSWESGPGGPEPFYVARGFQPTGNIVDGEIEARLELERFQR